MNSHLVAFLVFAMALGSANACALPATHQTDAAYVGATVYDGTAAAGRPDMVIVTRTGRIAAILPALNYRAPKGTEVVNVRGKFVIPGLINSHVHLATSANPSAAKAYLVVNFTAASRLSETWPGTCGCSQNSSAKRNLMKSHRPTSTTRR